MFLFCQAPAISTMTTNSGIYWCLARGHWLKHAEQDHQMDINALYPNHVPTPETQQQLRCAACSTNFWLANAAIITNMFETMYICWSWICRLHEASPPNPLTLHRTPHLGEAARAVSAAVRVASAHATPMVAEASVSHGTLTATAYGRTGRDDLRWHEAEDCLAHRSTFAARPLRHFPVEGHCWQTRLGYWGSPRYVDIFV